MRTIILLASEWVEWLPEGMANTRKYDNKLRTLKFRVNSLRVSVFIYRKFYFILIAQISYFSFSIVLSLCAFVCGDCVVINILQFSLGRTLLILP